VRADATPDPPPTRRRGRRDAARASRRARDCVVAIGLALAGCSSPPPHVVVVLIDTLRADRLGALGGDRDVAPFLDSLAGRSTVFQRAYAASSWTSPSVASLFTSRYPSQHGVTTTAAVIREEERTLAEAFRDLGYATGAFSGNLLVRKDLGYAQGFARFWAMRSTGTNLRRNYERAEGTAARALEWIDRRPDLAARPIFLYVHVMDPHTPYAPSAAALRWAFADSSPDVERLNEAVFEQKERELTAEERAGIERLYDAEVRSADDALAGFFRGLDERGVLANAIVVIVSDHGEEFWDHGSLGHANGLYEEQIRVPLLIHLPGQATRADIHAPVSLLDVAPTLVDLAGGAVPESFEGRSLRPMLHGGTALPPAPVVSELIQGEAFRRRQHERALVSGDAKLIADVGGAARIYDLAADPAERDAQEPTPSARAELAAELRRHVERMPASVEREEIPLDDATRAELQALV